MKIQFCSCAFLPLFALACGGAAATEAPTNMPSNTTTTTMGTAASSQLDGKSFDVMLDLEGEKSMKDTLNFTSGKFESTACTSFGFPKGTEYSARPEGELTEFQVQTKNPAGTTMDWKGTVKGDTVEGTAIRMMDGKTVKGTFKGTIRK